MRRSDVSCNGDKQVVLTISNVTLGLNPNEFNANTIQTYPNPTRSQLMLRNNSDYILDNVSILDVNGRIIEDINLKTSNTDYSISFLNYEPGLYIIMINSDNNYVIKKIIKM